MSHYMTALAMRQTGLKPAAKIVLYWLADHHNSETGACFPSLRKLAEECEMDKSTVARHLSALEDAGYIERKRQTRANGSQTSTAYKLTLTPVAECDTPCRKMQQAPVAKCNPLNLGSNNLGNLESVTRARGFDEFWQRYPRKVGKGEARKAYDKAMKKARHDDLMFALSQQLPALEAKERRYRPHPATWINGERWEDEPEQPNSAGRSGPSGSGNAMVDAFAAVAAERSARNGRG